MARTDLPESVAEEIRNRVFNENGFMKVTQVVRRGGGTFRVSLRQVVIKGEKKYQGEMTEDAWALDSYGDGGLSCWPWGQPGQLIRRR